MRVFNATHNEVNAAVKATFGMAAQWKFKGTGLAEGFTNKLDGWVQLGHSSPYAVYKAGAPEPHRYPCIHGYRALVQAIRQAKGTGLGWYAQPYGNLKVTSGTSGVFHSIGALYHSKGYTCPPTCPGWPPTGGQPTTTPVAQVTAPQGPSPEEP